MMAPDNAAYWHGMYEVAERFYMKLIPQAKEIVKHAKEQGKATEAKNVAEIIDEIRSRPEHSWRKTNPGNPQSLKKPKKN